MRTHAAWLLAATLALGACAGPDEPPEPREPPAGPPAGAGEGVLLDYARQPLDRARQAEQESAKRKGRLDEEIDAAQ